MAEHLLIVDDEPDLELLIKQRLRKHINEGKYCLHFAANGLEALNKITADPRINVVITDINMPIMNGLELLKKINEMKDTIIKVIIISAYSDMSNLRTAMNGGAFDFLTKPIDLADLENTIAKTVEIVQFIKDSYTVREQLDNYNRELYAANEIQQAILPKVFPPFPEIRQFDIYGHMEAAKMIGGDFFDFFLIGNDRIGFVIGDVSGKGTPAALFMAISRTILQTLGKTGMSPQECITQANIALCKESVDSMFVTVFYGILNYKTGELNYVNAGHNYPILINSFGNVTMLQEETCMIMGAFDDAKYRQRTQQLEPNSMIILYTDGVNEAADINNKQFGNDALMRYLAYASNKRNPKLVNQGIFDVVKQYSTGREQTDDISVLTLAYYGNF